MKIINLFAGPGAGKSTLRAEIFSALKRQSIIIEEVTEFAKDLTWDKHTAALSDQLFILANQNRRQDRLRGQVDWCVTDCPILLGINYTTPDYLPRHFKNLVREIWDTYDNHNFYIERAKPYVQNGRNQTEIEAREIDIKILDMLWDMEIPYTRVRGDDNAVKTIIESLIK